MPDTPDSVALAQLAADSLPLPMFAVDSRMRIAYANTLARARPDMEDGVELRCGDLLRCVRALRGDAVCGREPECPQCAVRATALEAIESGGTVRRVAVVSRRQGEETSRMHLFVTARKLPADGPALALLLLQDITEFVALSGFVPVCAGCQRIRDEAGEWRRPDEYLTEHLDIRVSHDMCPDCRDAFYGPLNGESKTE